ncbi:MAG: CRISPR-associated helicase Cas3' [Candidatus Pacearchaeota archaeon]
MSLYELLRAKSINEEEYEDKNLLLKDHIIQTMQRLTQLYDYIKRNKQFLTNILFTEEEKTKKLFISITKALFIHDLGKIDINFQNKLFNKKIEKDKLNEIKGNLKNWNTLRNIKRHEYSSLLWSYFLLNDEKDKEESGIIRTAILLHHYNKFYTNKEKELLEIIREDKEACEKYLYFIYTNKDKLKEFLQELIKELKETINYDFINEAIEQIELNFEKLEFLLKQIKDKKPGINFNMYEPEIDDKNYEKFIMMSGILKRCDHCASANISIETTESIENTFDKIKTEIEQKIKDKIWQKEILEDFPIEDGLLIAPTGSGKSEFALMWTEKQPRKLIYVLPLRVALNDLYKRFNEYIYTNSTEVTKNEMISILHSTAFIQYYEQEKENQDGSSIYQKLNTTKNFSTSIILTTPDQILLSSLNFFGSDKLKSLYPISTFVIDEIQAYNPEMAAVIIKSIQEIKNMGGNILLMTATYPPYFRKFLNNPDISPNFKESEKIKENKQIVKNYTKKRHKIELEKGPFINKKENIVNEKFKEKLKSYMMENKNILIICNTVKKSIKIYDFIKNEYKEYKDNTFILHSRLVEIQKQKKLERIKEKLGKQRIILVATQIVEASVDIDFDVLITEISPIDSQIQRWGRIFRNRQNDYDSNAPNILIFTENEDNVYYKNAVETTKQQLEEYLKNNSSKILSYEDEQLIVEKTFKEKINGKTLTEDYEEQIEYTLKNLNYFTVEKKTEAQRLFRKIAGVKYVFPDLMESNDTEQTEVIKEFAKILKNKEFRKKSWNQIIAELFKNKEELKSEEFTKIKLNLLKTIEQYSIQIPWWEKENMEKKKGKSKDEFYKFKDFYVYIIKEDNKKNELVEKGFDSIIEEVEDPIEDEKENFI